MSFPSYSDYDAQNIATSTNQMMASMGVTNAGDFAMKLTDLSSQVAFTNRASDAKQAHRISDSTKTDFHNHTNMYAQLNESYNANKYIVNTLSAEQKRINSVDSATKKDVYKLRQGLQYTTYMEQYYRFVTGIAMLTMFATVLILIPASMWRVNTMTTGSVIVVEAIILVLYMVVLVALVLTMSRQRKNAWGKYYWPLNTKLKDELESSSSSVWSANTTCQPVVNSQG
jgi:hypothetical protein